MEGTFMIYIYVILNNTMYLLSFILFYQVSERDKRITGYNTREESGALRDPSHITRLRVPTVRPMDLLVEASAR